MSYITTKVHALKSYSTYQLYVQAYPKSVRINDVFKICILETLRWIRSRLQEYPDLPQELNAPEPDDYSEYSDDRITSFSYNNGIQINVIYIDSMGVWSFQINEPDMGANIGTPEERKAVNGRSFTTEIALRKQSDNIEIGIRTVCSEPSNNTVDCEVFRPSMVKALAENQNIAIIFANVKKKY